jgi:hypothetical protein
VDEWLSSKYVHWTDELQFPRSSLSLTLPLAALPSSCLAMDKCLIYIWKQAEMYENTGWVRSGMTRCTVYTPQVLKSGLNTTKFMPPTLEEIKSRRIRWTHIIARMPETTARPHNTVAENPRDKGRSVPVRVQQRYTNCSCYFAHNGHNGYLTQRSTIPLEKLTIA